MAVTSQILYEDAERIERREYDDVARCETFRTEWKVGSEPYNRQVIVGKAAALRDALVAGSKEASSLSNAQRDARIRRLEAAAAYSISLQLEILKDEA